MRIPRPLRIVVVTFGVLLSGCIAGVFVVAGWLLMSANGARTLIDWVPRAGIGELEVRSVDGRLAGPLQLEGVKFSRPGLVIELDRARLEWTPGTLWRRLVHIDQLALGTLIVRISDSGEPPPPETAPALPQLPLWITVRRASVERLELHLPPQGEQITAPQIVDAIALEDLEWAGERLDVKRLAARHQAVGRVMASVQSRLQRQSVELDPLVVVLEGEKPIRIDAAGTVHLDAQDSKLTLNWKDVRWPLQGEPQVSSREGRVTLQGQLDDVKAQAAFALGDTAQIHADVRYAADRLEAMLDWTALTWPLAGEPRIASKSGALQFTGKPEAYVYELDAQLAAEGQSGSARATGSGGMDHVVLDTLRLAVAKAEIDGKGRVQWSPALTADADLRVKNVDPGLIAPDWPGRLNGTLKARTKMEDEVPHARFEIALKNSRLREYPLSLDTRGEAVGQTVKLDALHLVTGDTRLDARGQVTPPFDVTASLDSPDLAALWPGLGGRAKLDASVKGSIKAPHLTAKGNVQSLQYQGLAIQRVDVDADVQLAGEWKLDLDVLELSGPTRVARARLGVTGRDSAHVLKISVDAEPAAAELEARGAFDRARMAWNGSIESGKITPKDLEAWTLEEPAALRADSARVQLEPACWRAPESRVCLQAIREPSRMRGAFRVEQFDFAYFKSFLPQGWALTGGIDGSAMAEFRGGNLSEARADLSTDPIEVRRDGELLLKAERGSLLVEETGGRAIAKMQLPLQDGMVSFDGQLAANGNDFSSRPLTGQLDVSLHNLDFLRIASEEIREFRGRVDGRMNWSGTLAKPQPVGEVKLSEGHVKLATPGIEINDLRARVGTGPDSKLVIDASATSGGGTMTLNGEVDLAAEKTRVQLAVRGDQFQAANMTEARAWVSPKLDLKIDGDQITLSGDVEVPRAEITPVSFDSGVGPSSDQVIVTGEQTPVERAGMQLSADVRVILGKQVRFEGFGLKTRLEGSVRAIEQPGRPGSGRGEVRLVEGRYKAYGQDLQIETGRLLFNGGPLTEPAIDIRALRKPREDIEVGVFVRGTLDKPEFQLFSTPTMPRERQLSWLVLGRSLEEGGGADEKAMMANAALSLGLTGTDFLAQNLRGGLGLDEVTIGADPGDDANEARFTVGKYLSPKLYVSYGVGIFQPGQVFKLLYELGRGFKFSTESGIHTGGDLLYTLER